MELEFQQFCLFQTVYSKQFEFWQNGLKVQCLWTAKETQKEMISGVTKWDLCELTHLVKLKY